MYYDLTVKISAEEALKVNATQNFFIPGHVGTHFDVMNKEFPLDCLHLNAIIFNVTDISHEEITSSDIDIQSVEEGTFVLFYTGWEASKTYGTKEYFTLHPYLSKELIDKLVEKKIRIIGLDAPGVRRQAEHTPMDQYLADRNIFVIENLCNIGSLVKDAKVFKCAINTYPLNYSGMTGLPCRVVCEN